MNQPSARAQQEQDARIPYPANTIFIVPEIPYDVNVIRGYLNKKYKNIPRDMVASQLNMQHLPHVRDLSIIVCVRRGTDGNPPGPAYNVVPDERGILREKPIAPETYHNEVYESPALHVADYVKAGAATLFSQTETDLNPLIDEMCRHAYPCRVTPQNKPDFMLRCVVGV